MSEIDVIAELQKAVDAKCPQCGSDDPHGLAMKCDRYTHPWHLKAICKRPNCERCEPRR